MRIKRMALLVFVLMFVLPSLVNISPANYDVRKTYTASYTHHDQIWIQSNEEFHTQAEAEHWDGDGSEENPYVVTGYLFDCESQPLRIWHTTIHWIFVDNVIDGVGSNVLCGTWLDNVTHGTLVDNEILNRHSGMAITGNAALNVTGNHIHDCWGSGIEIMGIMNQTIIENNIIEDIGGAGVYSSMSEDSVVRNNIISNCESLGIGLVGTSLNCNVTGNVITNSDATGIMISYAQNGFISGNSITNVMTRGIYMNSPDHCVISENTIGDVVGSGLKVTSGEHDVISDNIVENCTLDGIVVSSTNASVHWNSVYNVTGYAVNLESGSSHVSVKFNTFIENGVTCQVCDDGTSNTVSQNYYDDWDSPDANSDGYVDTPYSLDGAAENQDALPLAVAGTIPTTSPDDSPLSVELILVSGALGVIVIVVAVLLVKRR